MYLQAASLNRKNRERIERAVGESGGVEDEVAAFERELQVVGGFGMRELVSFAEKQLNML